MQPCSLKRRLQLYPTVSARGSLKTDLGPDSQLWEYLPAVFKQEYVSPALWQAGQQLTLMLIATACLTAFFMALRPETNCIGYWLAVSTEGEKQNLRAEHVSTGRSLVSFTDWWKVWRVQHDWDEMNQQEKGEINQKAAMALFTNPPVSKGKAITSGTFRLIDACMCCKSGEGNNKFILWRKKYPQLVLQFAGKTEDGDRFPQVSVPAHQLVAWLFLGPNSTGMCVCHYDVPPTDRDVKWEQRESVRHMNALCAPKSGRCLSTHCVSPLCLHYSTQSDNASTGKDRKQLPSRKAKRKVPMPFGD